jgi:chitinase
MLAAASVVVPLAVTTVTGSAAARPTAHHVDRWVMGYYPVYNRARQPISQIDWAAMTHIVVGPALPQADGTVATGFNGYRTHPFVKRLVRAAKAHHVVPVLMIGGAGANEGFAAAAKNHRAAFVSNLLATMKQFGFAGLDLDWEPVESSDAPALTALVAALRQAAPHAVLTMPVGIVTITKGFRNVPSFYGTLSHDLDRINVMTYGMAGAYGGWKTWHSSALRGAGASTPSDVAFNVQQYRKAGVPAAKLGIGVGFYGSCWAGGVTRPRQSIGSSSIVADDNVMSWANIMSAYYEKSAYHYDRAAQAPYLSYPHGHGPQHCSFISYENQRSIAAKGAYAEKQGLGSEIIWAINEGHVKSKHGAAGDPLLAAVRRSFH